jgi:hypothetical protein
MRVFRQFRVISALIMLLSMFEMQAAIAACKCSGSMQIEDATTFHSSASTLVEKKHRVVMPPLLKNLLASGIGRGN